MKRFGLLTFVGLLAVFAMMIASCGGGPDDVTPEVPVDTTPVVEEPVVEEAKDETKQENTEDEKNGEL